MIFGKLIDHVWATRKASNLEGLKFMLAETNVDGCASRMIVADIIGAGIGDRVIIAQGSAARKMLSNDNIPVDAAVIGIIDESCDNI